MTLVDLDALRRRHEEVARAVEARGSPQRTDRVGGLDCAYPGGEAAGAAVVLDTDTNEVVDQAVGRVADPVPYVPGFLFARELPAYEAAFSLLPLTAWRDVTWLVDGHGLLHPDRAGVACHVGVTFSVQAVGVGKSPLVPHRELELDVGEAHPLHVKGELRGYALRPTRRTRNPIYVSPGHRIGAEEALELVRGLCRFKLPEPVRAADALAGARS